jgi:hypothetical protein|tara:strand:+ start:507 stop:752 length:246 start_codon:yes stop_codon:yes gene_type:complete
MTDILPEPKFESPQEELAWLKQQMRFWRKNSMVVSADALYFGYLKRHQKLRKQIETSGVPPEAPVKKSQLDPKPPPTDFME